MDCCIPIVMDYEMVDKDLDMDLDDVWETHRTKSNSRGQPRNQARLKKHGPFSRRSGDYNHDSSSKHGRSLSLSRDKRRSRDGDDARSMRSNLTRTINNRRSMSDGRIGAEEGGSRRGREDHSRNGRNHGGESRGALRGASRGRSIGASIGASRGRSRAGSRAGSMSRRDTMEEYIERHESQKNKRQQQRNRSLIAPQPQRRGSLRSVERERNKPTFFGRRRNRSKSNHYRNNRFNSSVHSLDDSFDNEYSSHDEENNGRKKKGLFGRFRRRKRENIQDDQSSSSSESSGIDDDSSDERGGFFGAFRS